MKKVLIVDDNRDLADGVAAIFSIEGIHADVAYKGASGMEAMLEIDYDVVFLDAKLPDSNGIKLYKEIRAKKPALEIVLITGYRIEQLLSQYVTDGKVEAISCTNKSGLEYFVSGSNFNDIGVVRCRRESDFKSFIDKIELIGKSTGRNIFCLNIDDNIEEARPRENDILVLDANNSLLNIFDFYIEEKNKGNQFSTVIVQRSDVRTENVMESFKKMKCIFKPFDPEDLLKIVTGLNNDKK
jgi:DNA-binding response OmpR family regulator